MDVREKQTLVKGWLRLHMNGFEMLEEAYNPATHALTVAFKKAEFPEVITYTMFTDETLRNTSPKVLLNTVLPERLKDLTTTYQRLLREHRLER